MDEVRSSEMPGSEINWCSKNSAQSGEVIVCGKCTIFISAWARPAMFHVDSVCDKIRSALTQSAIKFVPRWLSMRLDVHVETVKIWPLIENPWKFVAFTHQTLNVDSSCNKIVSALTQPVSAKNFVYNQKSLTKTRVDNEESKLWKTYKKPNCAADFKSPMLIHNWA